MPIGPQVPREFRGEGGCPSCGRNVESCLFGHSMTRIKKCMENDTDLDEYEYNVYLCLCGTKYERSDEWPEEWPNDKETETDE